MHFSTSSAYNITNQPSSNVVGAGLICRAAGTTSGSTTHRKACQSLHQHSRTGIPNLQNLQQVRKTVYSQIGPSQQLQQQTTSSAATSNATIISGATTQHQRKKTTASILQSTTPSMTVAQGVASDTVKLNQSSATGQQQTNHHHNPMVVTGGLNHADNTQNQSSLLTVPASPLSSRHTHHNVTTSQNNGLNNAMMGLQQMDDSTVISTGQNTTTTTHPLVAGASACSKTPSHLAMLAQQSHLQQNAATSNKCVTHEILLNTVKALVGYFEEKILEIASNNQTITTSKPSSKKQQMIADQQQVANKESTTTSKTYSSSAEIIDRISQMLLIPLRTEALNQPLKNSGKHNNIGVQQQIGGNNKTYQKNSQSNKENTVTQENGRKHSSAKKIRVEDVEQLTMAQVVPPGELGSAASVKAGHTSTRSHNPPKSSRSKKKNDKKQDNHLAKAPAAQPFKANNQILNSQRPSTTSQSQGHNTKKASGATGRQSTGNHLNQQKRASANSSRISSTTNLFKPNPNFANSRKYQLQAAAAATVSSQHQQQPSVQKQTQSNHQHQQRNNNNLTSSASQKRLASHDPAANAIITAAAAAHKEHQSVISAGDAAGHDLDGDSGILPNISYRNHFQDIYSNSSLLKSIGREEDDSGHLNFITHQQLTEDQRVKRDTTHDEKKTPGLGADASGKLKSSSQQRKASESGPFALANPMKYNTSLSNVTSTFKIEKHEEDAEVVATQCERKTAFDQSQEIVNPADVTPEKAQDNLLHLLSNLEGLTPAGLEHLMETQDKLASTTIVKRPDSHLTELDLHSRKHSEQPNFTSGARTSIQSNQYMNIHQNHSQTRPQSIPRRTQTGSSTARQALRFVDTSDQQSIPSPAPVVNYNKSHATLEPPTLSSSRFLDAPIVNVPGVLNTSRAATATAQGAEFHTINHHQSSTGNGGGVQKRLVYESLINESGKQPHQSSVNHYQASTHQTQVQSTRHSATPRMSHVAGAQSSRQTVGTTTRRHKSTKNGAGSIVMNSQTSLAQLHSASGAGASQMNKGFVGNNLHSSRGGQQHSVLSKAHSVLDQRRHQSSNNGTRNHTSNYLGSAGGNHHHTSAHQRSSHQHHQSYKTSATTSGGTNFQTIPHHQTSSKQVTNATTSRPTGSAQLSKPANTSSTQQVLSGKPQTSSSTMISNVNTTVAPVSQQNLVQSATSVTMPKAVTTNSNRVHQSAQEHVSQQQQNANNMKNTNTYENSNNAVQKQSSSNRPIQQQPQQQILMPPLNDHFMAKKLITPTSSQATMLTSRIQQQHQQLKAFEAAAATTVTTTTSASGHQQMINSSRTLTRTNSQSRYEDRFKQLTQLVEKHQSQSVEQQIDIQGANSVGTPNNRGVSTANMQLHHAATLQSHHQQVHHHHQQRHFTEQVRRVVTQTHHQQHTAKTTTTTSTTTPQLVDSKSTESTVVERETVFKIGIESEPLSSEECYTGKGDAENSATKSHLNDENQNNERSYTSEKVASKEMNMLVQQNNHRQVCVKAAIEGIEDDKHSQGGESMGSLERQIQQIVLSKDLLQEMDIDLKEVDDMNNAAGSVLEPSEEQARCLMLRQGVPEFNQTSGMGMNTAQELEPSLPPDQLNLSGEDVEVHHGLDDDHVQHFSPPMMADEAQTVQQQQQFDPNTSNISFG